MSLTTAVHSGASSVEPLTQFSQVGAGIGGIFLTILLTYLLAYLNVVKASKRDFHRLRLLLVTAGIPLLFAFAGMIVFASLRTLELL